MFDQIKRWQLGKQYSYETLFKGQDRRSVGKPGVILADIGMPEEYDPEFYISYMDHVFRYTLPPFLHSIVLIDRGIALIDPQNPLAREPFEPRKSCLGSYELETEYNSCIGHKRAVGGNLAAL
jgi:hypothetical protein